MQQNLTFLTPPFLKNKKMIVKTQFRKQHTENRSLSTLCNLLSWPNYPAVRYQFAYNDLTQSMILSMDQEFQFLFFKPITADTSLLVVPYQPRFRHKCRSPNRSGHRNNSMYCKGCCSKSLRWNKYISMLKKLMNMLTQHNPS